MTMPRSASTNPFFSHRWETETRHTVWVPPEVSTAASLKACFISGLRGTGKTVLLNCLSLQPRQAGNYFSNPQDLPGNCIGVYISILSEFTHFFDITALQDRDGERTGPDETRSHLHNLAFKTYVVFNCLSRVLEHIDEARRCGFLTYTTDQEFNFVRDFLGIWNSNFESRLDLGCGVETILDCASLLDKTCMSVRVNSVRLYSDRVEALISAIEPAKFYLNICNILNKGELLRTSEKSFHVKICLDDAHRFLRSDQVLLNDIVALNSSPIGWNISFVTGQYDQSVTHDVTAPLTNHDVHRIDLDYMEDHRRFRQLCSKMYQMRIASLGASLEEADHGTSLAEVFGNIGPAALFDDIVAAQGNGRFADLVAGSREDAAAILLEAGISGALTSTGNGSDAPLLVDAYIYRMMCGSLPDRMLCLFEGKPVEERDKQLGMLRESALISASKELGLQPVYAGYDVLTSLADGCVRDFLQIMAIVYDLATAAMLGGSDDEDLIGKPDADWDAVRFPIPIQIQSTSFLSASRQYLRQFDEPTDSVGRVLSNIVYAVGRLIELLQSDPSTAPSTLGLGLIEFDFAEGEIAAGDADRAKLLRRAIIMGQYIGVIRLIRGTTLQARGNPGSDLFLFRIHNLVSPGFRSLSRPPWVKLKIELGPMLALAEDIAIDFDAWAKVTHGRCLTALLES